MFLTSVASDGKQFKIVTIVFSLKLKTYDLKLLLKLLAIIITVA